MKFITSKLNIVVPNFHIDSLNHTLILYSKNNTEFKIQFDNQLEVNNLIGDLNLAYHLNDVGLMDEIKELEDQLEITRNQLYSERNGSGIKDRKIEELQDKLSSIRSDLEGTINEYL